METYNDLAKSVPHKITRNKLDYRFVIRKQAAGWTAAYVYEELNSTTRAGKKRKLVEVVGVFLQDALKGMVEWLAKQDA